MTKVKAFCKENLACFANLDCRFCKEKTSLANTASLKETQLIKQQAG